MSNIFSLSMSNRSPH